ncbi:superoxide dismutase [Cu-Zn] 5-like [Arctopsyche grandis]|uniref:superoxide dismutase [Cu-Zn] 5-like n=1 Tax=Arctopsyche grandis TaxID=121162 RepID=UPI00406DA271
MKCVFYIALIVAVCSVGDAQCHLKPNRYPPITPAPTTPKPTTSLPTAPPQPRQAIVRLQGPTVNGNVTFTQPFNGGIVKIEGTILGLTTGKYGFHVHAKGDLTGGCVSAGPHYNPLNRTHGAANAAIRHVGDLGNIVTDENNSTIINFTDSIITLIGEYSIIGRAVVVHGREDDLGLTDHVDSKSTGNAGPRVSCGVIGIK